jgi:hypothetical protein
VIDLPQIILPSLLFHVVLSGLICAATWHALDIVLGLVKMVRTPRNNRS